MTRPLTTSDAPVRRHHSQKRERVLAWLRATASHPTAQEIHTALVSELPSLSLATVYRNLDVLVAEGQVDEVSVASGPTRYDGNLTPHHHFSCESCGQILDVEIGVPRGLVHRLAGSHGHHAKRVRISFTGTCAECDQASASLLAEVAPDSVRPSVVRSQDDH